MVWWIIGGIVWIVGGYFFTRWFIANVLDDGRWIDTGKKANPLFIHLVSPYMMIVFGFLFLLHLLSNIPNVFRKVSGGGPDFIRKFYKVK